MLSYTFLLEGRVWRPTDKVRRNSQLYRQQSTQSITSASISTSSSIIIHIRISIHIHISVIISVSTSVNNKASSASALLPCSTCEYASCFAVVLPVEREKGILALRYPPVDSRSTKRILYKTPPPHTYSTARTRKHAPPLAHRAGKRHRTSEPVVGCYKHLTGTDLKNGTHSRLLQAPDKYLTVGRYKRLTSAATNSISMQL